MRAQYNYQYGPKTKPKKEKVIPRFPPQYNAKEVQTKKDSIANALKKPKQTTTTATTTKKQLTTIDGNYKVISSTVDADGNKVEVIQKKVNGYTITQTIKSSGQKLNVPFNADTINKDSIKIVIDKAKYKLMVYYRNRYLTSYRCVFGIQPHGQKLHEGDKRTPEGDFIINDIHPHTEWSYFFGINYPNSESYRLFEMAKAKGQIPAGKSIGGNVGIHGVIQGADAMVTDKHNWTDGCISINNKDIAELNKIIKMGTPISIRPFK